MPESGGPSPKPLATQSANGTYDNEVDRANLDKEFQTLKEEFFQIFRQCAVVAAQLSVRVERHNVVLNDGISLVQTAEGALTEVHSMLNRMTYHRHRRKRLSGQC